jgi:hypothetical protein
VTRLHAADKEEIVRRLRTVNASADVYSATCTTTFVNRYRDEVPESRVQWLESLADSFEPAHLRCKADIFIFGPLNPLDFSVDLVVDASCTSMVALDIQGLLRSPGIGAVGKYRHPELARFLGASTIVKASREEALYAADADKVEDSIDYLLSAGVSEALITLGSEGSIVATESSQIEVSAFPPNEILDTTGCGDVYLAVYVVKRLQGQSMQDAAHAASAAAGLSAAVVGPPRISDEDIAAVLNRQSG